jgi:hypothetical protein
MFVPVHSRFQAFSLQIFFCSAYSCYLKSLRDDISPQAHNCGGVSFSDLLNLLISLEAPVLCLQQLVQVMSHDAVLESLSEWEQLSLISGSVRYCTSILRMCLGGKSRPALSATSTRNIAALCVVAHTTISKIAARCTTFHLSLGTTALHIVQALQLISSHFEDVQLWTCDREQGVAGMPYFVQESTRQLTYFFLVSLHSLLSCRTGGCGGGGRREADLAALLPAGVLRVLLRCCLDPPAQHWAACCWSVLLLQQQDGGGGSQGQEHQRGQEGRSRGVSRTGLAYVEWCLQPSSSSSSSLSGRAQMEGDTTPSPHLWQELQTLTIDVMQSEGDSKTSSAMKNGPSSIEEALQLNKVGESTSILKNLNLTFINLQTDACETCLFS